MNWDAYKSNCSNKIMELKKESEIEPLSDQLISCLKKSADETIKIKSKKTDRITDLPDFLVKIIRKKNKWSRKYRKTRSSIAKENVNILNDIIQLEITKFHSEKMKRFLERLGPRPLSTIPKWRKITRLKNQRRSGEMPTLIKDENEYTTNEEKA